MIHALTLWCQAHQVICLIGFGGLILFCMLWAMFNDEMPDLPKRRRHF